MDHKSSINIGFIVFNGGVTTFFAKSVSCHKLSQNDNFVSKYPSSVATILKLRFQDHVTDFLADPDFRPGPAIQLGLDLIEGEICGIICDFNALYMFYCCHCSAAYHDAFTAL